MVHGRAGISCWDNVGVPKLVRNHRCVEGLQLVSVDGWGIRNGSSELVDRKRGVDVGVPEVVGSHRCIVEVLQSVSVGRRSIRFV